MVKQRSLGPENMDDGTDASSAFLDALRTRAMDDLHLAALEYGIVMKDLGASLHELVFGRRSPEFRLQLSSTGSSRVSRNRTLTGGSTLTHVTGDIAHTMDKLTTRALQAQVEAAVRPHPSSPAFSSHPSHAERRSREQQQDQARRGRTRRRPHQGPGTERPSRFSSPVPPSLN